MSRETRGERGGAAAREASRRATPRAHITLVRHGEPDWTPERVIAEFLEEIQSGAAKPVKIMVHYFERNADGDLVPHHWCSGISPIEAIGLATCIVDRLVKEAKVDE